uniref:Uncharacterized protein n=1 Tax=Trieres chinensis TaxID=1514140 RepID=A0A7S2A844_TRICV|mmetsp:Transcript_6174/g.12931  ORF Transcript_6174/g.12931 Transcript_6174/m.12931 type:complete len:181 (+) Transcript_6174:268-810(+)
MRLIMAAFAAQASFIAAGTSAFLNERSMTGPTPVRTRNVLTRHAMTRLEELTSSIELDPNQCEKFKVLTCMATSCSRKLKSLGVDEFATFGALWQRKEDANANGLQVEESSCLGSCKFGPCVAVEHEDYVGAVSLEGMTQDEFNARAFHSVITDEDMDRVWQSVANAICIMANEEQEEAE